MEHISIYAFQFKNNINVQKTFLCAKTHNYTVQFKIWIGNAVFQLHPILIESN